LQKGLWRYFYFAFFNMKFIGLKTTKLRTPYAVTHGHNRVTRTHKKKEMFSSHGRFSMENSIESAFDGQQILSSMR
jgi:hypothetical protein